MVDELSHTALLRLVHKLEIPLLVKGLLVCRVYYSAVHERCKL